MPITEQSLYQTDKSSYWCLINSPYETRYRWNEYHFTYILFYQLLVVFDKKAVRKNFAIFIGKHLEEHLRTNWVKSVKYRVISGPYFSCIWTEHTKIRTENNSVSGHILNQSFKRKLAHKPFLNLTPKFSFEARFRIFIINGCDRKSKHL